MEATWTTNAMYRNTLEKTVRHSVIKTSNLRQTQDYEMINRNLIMHNWEKNRQKPSPMKQTTVKQLRSTVLKILLKPDLDSTVDTTYEWLFNCKKYHVFLLIKHRKDATFHNDHFNDYLTHNESATLKKYDCEVTKPLQTYWENRWICEFLQELHDRGMFI